MPSSSQLQRNAQLHLSQFSKTKVLENYLPTLTATSSGKNPLVTLSIGSEMLTLQRSHSDGSLAPARLLTSYGLMMSDYSICSDLTEKAVVSSLALCTAPRICTWMDPLINQVFMLCLFGPSPWTGWFWYLHWFGALIHTFSLQWLMTVLSKDRDSPEQLCAGIGSLSLVRADCYILWAYC